MKKQFSITLSFIIILCILCSSYLTTYASNAINEIYYQSFVNGMPSDYWSAFGTPETNLSISSAHAEQGLALKLSNHTQSWYSPRFEITKAIYDSSSTHKAGTYGIKL